MAKHHHLRVGRRKEQERDDHDDDGFAGCPGSVVIDGSPNHSEQQQKPGRGGQIVVPVHADENRTRRQPQSQGQRHPRPSGKTARGNHDGDEAQHQQMQGRIDLEQQQGIASQARDQGRDDGGGREPTHLTALPRRPSLPEVPQDAQRVPIQPGRRRLRHQGQEVAPVVVGGGEGKGTLQLKREPQQERRQGSKPQSGAGPESGLRGHGRLVVVVAIVIVAFGAARPGRICVRRPG